MFSYMYMNQASVLCGEGAYAPTPPQPTLLITELCPTPPPTFEFQLLPLYIGVMTMALHGLVEVG